MNEMSYDIAVIGGGCAGMAAACAAKEAGAGRVLILERASWLGGVLRQCIHNGFGIHQFQEDLTGTEYAGRLIQMTKEAGIDVLTDTTVLQISKERTILAVNRNGLIRIQAGALLIATGCRERPRGALAIPGTRPAGVMTAGTAQRFLNLEGYLPGKEIVILGSGDIGLIMARQFILEDVDVKAVAEILPYSSGLTRNIFQCIEDFQIPLYYNTTVTRIEGEKRVTGVVLSKVDEKRRPIPGTERFLCCDSLILSVGLIPENELLWQAGVPMDPGTGGAIVDDTYQSAVPGIFACGNALHVHDLADYVVQESQKAGRSAALWVKEQPKDSAPLIHVQAGNGVRGLVPQKIRAGSAAVSLQFRPASRYQDCRIAVYSDDRIIFQKKERILTPGEMYSIHLKGTCFEKDLKVQVED